MEHKEEQSSDNIDNIDNTELPFVTALTTPFPQTSVGPHAETLRKIKEREKENGIKSKSDILINILRQLY